MKIVVLPASVSSDLVWTSQIEAMRSSIDSLWVFLDFGIGSSPFFLEDSATFHSLLLAVSQFSREVWPLIKERCQGVILFRGSLSALSLLSSSERDWTAVKAATAFGDYLHRLASFLPDEAAAYCLFEDHGSFTPGEAAHLLSSERFLHLSLSLHPCDSPIGVLLPPDELCSGAIIQKLDQLLARYQEQKMALRVIPERRLNELWNGLDELIIFEEALSSQGKRHLIGFEVAGGVVKRFGAEGFEPPTHCSQSSCASQTALCSERESIY